MWCQTIFTQSLAYCFLAHTSETSKVFQPHVKERGGNYGVIACYYYSLKCISILCANLRYSDFSVTEIHTLVSGCIARSDVLSEFHISQPNSDNFNARGSLLNVSTYMHLETYLGIVPGSPRA
jgi:hypothetical protein